MNPRYYLLAAFVIALVIAWYSSSAQMRLQAPQPGSGRPGEFHFILAEQAEQNRVQFREMRSAIERVRSELATGRFQTEQRSRIQQDLDRLDLFVLSMEQQMTQPAGPVAGEVEAKLNAAKGDYMCGACHGHGFHAGGESPR